MNQSPCIGYHPRYIKILNNSLDINKKARSYFLIKKSIDAIRIKAAGLIFLISNIDKRHYRKRTKFHVQLSYGHSFRSVQNWDSLTGPDLNIRRSKRDASKRFFLMSPRLNIEIFLTISGNASNGKSQRDICRQSSSLPISKVSKGVYCNYSETKLKYKQKELVFT